MITLTKSDIEEVVRVQVYNQVKDQVWNQVYDNFKEI
jgi:hypothetical protein